MANSVYKRQDSYNWFVSLEDRWQREIEYSKLYDTPSFRHGTDGNLYKLIISDLVKKLNEYEDNITDMEDNSKIKLLKEEIEELRDEYNDLKSDYDLQKNCDCDDCDELVNVEINDLESSNQHLSSELEDAYERIKELERAFEQLSELEKSNQELYTKLSDAHEEIGKLKTEDQ